MKPIFTPSERGASCPEPGCKGQIVAGTAGDLGTCDFCQECGWSAEIKRSPAGAQAEHPDSIYLRACAAEAHLDDAAEPDATFLGLCSAYAKAHAAHAVALAAAEAAFAGRPIVWKNAAKAAKAARGVMEEAQRLILDAVIEIDKNGWHK